MIFIITGFLLLIAEAFIPLFGFLGLAGLTLVITGSLLSLNESLIDFGLGTIFAASFAMALMLGGGLLYTFRAYRQKTRSGKEGLIGSIAHVVDWDEKQGRVNVDGENWHATSLTPLDLAPDTKVAVQSIDGLSLTITPFDTSNSQTKET